MCYVMFPYIEFSLLIILYFYPWEWSGWSEGDNFLIKGGIK